MRKLLSIILATCCYAANGNALPNGGPYTNNVDDVNWVFYISEGEATLGGGTTEDPACIFHSSSKVLTIPSTLGGYPVRRISEYALSCFTCYAETIILPEGLYDISTDAFYGTFLKSVVIPSTVTNIGSSAFVGARNLQTVSISGNDLRIGKRAFQASGSDYGTIWSVQIAATNLVVEDYAFLYQDLDRVVISGKDIEIGYSAFQHKTTSTSKSAIISISGDDIQLGDCAFTKWKQKELEIELNGRISIGGATFAQCGKNKVNDQSNGRTWLTRGGVSLTVSPDCVFQGNKPFSSGALGTVSLPTLADVFATEGWLRFASGQFYFYTPEGFVHFLVPSDTQREVVDLVIPDGIVSVPDNALGETRFLSITVPDSVKTIGQCAFAGCLATNIVLPSRLTSIGQGAFRGNRMDTIRIPAGVTSIPSNMLANCTSLGAVVFPSSVTELGQDVFLECTSLTNVTFDCAPPSGLLQSGLKTSVLIRYNQIYEGQWQTALTEGGFENSVACQPSTWEVTLQMYPFAESTNITVNAGDRYEDIPPLDFEWMDFEGWGDYDNELKITSLHGEMTPKTTCLYPVYRPNEKLLDPSGCCEITLDPCATVASGTYRDQSYRETDYSPTWGWHLKWADSLCRLYNSSGLSPQTNEVVVAQIKMRGAGRITIPRIDNFGLFGTTGYYLTIQIDGGTVASVTAHPADSLDTYYDNFWAHEFYDSDTHVIKLVVSVTSDFAQYVMGYSEACLHISEIEWTPYLQVSFNSGDNGACSHASSWAHIGYWDDDQQAMLEKGKCHVWNEPTVIPESGWSFIGWDRDLEDITESTTVTARYAAIEYPITYTNTHGVTNDNVIVYTITNSITFKPLPNCAEAEFIGWTPECIPLGTTGEVAVVANWQIKDNTDTPWTNTFSKSLSAANEQHRPLIVIWSNIGCSYCEVLHNALLAESVSAWLNSRNYFSVYAVGASSTDGSAAKAFAKDSSGKFPYVAVYLYDGNVTNKVTFVGRNGLMPCESGELIDQFTNSVDLVVKAFKTGPIPELGNEAPSQEVATALIGSADKRLTECITNATTYHAYREWAANVKNTDGSGKAGLQKVKEACNAWFSFAVGSDKLISELPTSEGVKVDAFTHSSESGKFDFTISIDGVTVSEDALKENLKQVFGLEGSTTLDSNDFSSDNVDIDFDTPENGKVKFTAGPKSGNANTGTFFMKVKVNP